MKTEKVDANADLTVVPEGGAKKPGIAKIATFEYIGSTKLKAIYPKDDDFREATKSSGFYWKDGVWQRRAGNEFAEKSSALSGSVPAPPRKTSSARY